MTFRSIDKRRFAYLLEFGTDEYELRRFFSDCRVQLIQRGGRVQNLPSGEKARIRTLVHELPSTTDEVVRAWFSENLTMSDPESPEQIVETFKLHEEVEEDVDEQTARRLARSCLVHLFSDPPPPQLLEFLRTSIGGEPKTEEQQTTQTTTTVEFVQWQNIVLVMLDLMQGHDADRHVDGLPADIAAAATGLQAAAKGRFDEARQALESLPADAPSRAPLEQYIRQQEARGRQEPPRGPAIGVGESFAASFDFERDEILGYCTKAESPNAVFVHPIGVIRANVLYTLSAEVRRRLFPSTGDVMSFPGSKYPKQPRRGEVGIWHVEEHPTDKATHFHITGEPRRVYELVSVPFASTEYDSVREFVKEHAQRATAAARQPPIFVLADGLIVGARTEGADLSKDDAFEAGLLSWNSLTGWRLEGRQFVFGPLPKEQGLYECPPIESSIRRLLRPYLGAATKSALSLTKAQLAELTRLLGSGDVDLTARRLQRVKSDLGQILLNQNALDALIEELKVQPEVREKIDAFIKEEGAKRLAEKTELQADIVRLQKERGEWEEKIRKQKEDHRKLRDDTAKVVRAAFEKAKTEGVATLAELAIFQELTGSGHNQSSPVPAVHAQFQPRIRSLPRVESDPIAVLRSLGVPHQRATAFAELSKAIFGTGMILCVRGVASRNAVERWAQSIGNGSLVEATVGLIEDGCIKDLLNASPKPQAMAILDANLSPLDIYARPLADVVISSVSNGGAVPAILFSLSESVGHLATPTSFERLSITIDLEARYDFSGTDVDELVRTAFDVEEGVVRARLWKPIADKLHSNISKLDAQTQLLVLPILIEKQVAAPKR